MTDNDPTLTPMGPSTDAAASVTFSRRFLLLVGALVVVLAFVAAFAGARLGAPAAAPAPAPTVTVEPSPEPEAEADDAAEVVDEAELVETVLPAGSDVRAGRGTPAAAYGDEGDVYIDLDSTGIYLRQDGGWTRVGDIRTAAAENLTGAQGEKGATGAQGEAGATGAQGETGAAGADGADGTRVALATEAPSGACTGDDIVVDTVTVSFFQCVDGTWTAFGP